MKTGVWTYENAEKQIVYFRGFVKRYIGRTVEEIPCPEVRKNKAHAVRDAKILLKKLKESKVGMQH